MPEYHIRGGEKAVEDEIKRLAAQLHVTHEIGAAVHKLVERGRDYAEQLARRAAPTIRMPAGSRARGRWKRSSPGARVTRRRCSCRTTTRGPCRSSTAPPAPRRTARWRPRRPTWSSRPPARTSTFEGGPRALHFVPHGEAGLQCEAAKPRCLLISTAVGACYCVSCFNTSAQSIAAPQLLLAPR